MSAPPGNRVACSSRCHKVQQLSRHEVGALSIVLGVAVLAILTSAMPEPMTTLAWHADTRSTRWWSAMTAQFVHLGWAHLLVNLTALAILAYAAKNMQRVDELANSLIAASACVALCLTVLPPAQAWYVGLSGMLHGAFAWTTLRIGGYPDWPGRFGIALYLGGLAKSAIDLVTEPGLVNTLGVAVAPAPHFYGYLGGSLFALLRRRADPPPT